MSIKSDGERVYFTTPDQSGFGGGDLRGVVRVDAITGIGETVFGYDEQTSSPQVGTVVATRQITYLLQQDTFEEVCAALGWPSEAVEPEAPAAPAE